MPARKRTQHTLQRASRRREGSVGTLRVDNNEEGSEQRRMLLREDKRSSMKAQKGSRCGSSRVRGQFSSRLSVGGAPPTDRASNKSALQTHELRCSGTAELADGQLCTPRTRSRTGSRAVAGPLQQQRSSAAL